MSTGHDPADDLDPAIRTELLRWRRSVSGSPPTPTAQRARVAMLRALWEQRQDTRGIGVRRRLGLVRESMLGVGRRRLVSVGVAMMLITVLSLGWSAPAGTPLHVVRMAREDVSVQLAGSGANTLRLEYAADAERDAEHAPNRAPALSDARGWLQAVRANVGSGGGPALRSRFTQLQQDENSLVQGPPATPAAPAAEGSRPPSATDVPSSPPHDSAGSGSAGGGQQGQGTAGGGHQRSGAGDSGSGGDSPN